MAVQKLEAGHDDPVLALDDIQCDILIGLQKDGECFLFFTIADLPLFKAALHAAVLLGLVTSASIGKSREQQIASLKAARDKTRIPIPGMNIGFTHRGLGKMLGDPNYAVGKVNFDSSFQAGASARAQDLGDVAGLWPQVFQQGALDGVMLITGGDELEADMHANAILSLFGSAIDPPVFRQNGATRPGQRGHEHFGFLDGVSQPGIRGLTARENPNDPNQGLPGQDLLWPGEFVFGYDGQKPANPGDQVSKDDPDPAKPLPFSWMKNGSFMVWRRLEQDVPAFNAAVHQEAERLEMDVTLLAARMVGRWPSGAPVVMAPLQDAPMLAASPFKNNDFEYGRDDPDQRRCPYAAHIRKTYPRDDLNGIFGGEAGEASVQTRRIRRAGIPFGPDFDEEADNASESRGLMFVCYQTSIPEQFEFVQKDWANNQNFVPGKVYPKPTGGSVTPGLDPIIGQGGSRDMDEPFPNYPAGSRRETLKNLPQFVTATAAGYFFLPSLSALKNGLGVP